MLPNVAEVDRSTYKRLSRPGFNTSIAITQTPVKRTSPRSKDVSILHTHTHTHTHRNQGSKLRRGRDSSVYKSIQTASGGPFTLLFNKHRSAFHGGRVAKAWSMLPVSTYRRDKKNSWSYISIVCAPSRCGVYLGTKTILFLPFYYNPKIGQGSGIA